MTNAKSGLGMAFLAFGIITIISGIFLMFRGDYISGFCGACVGAFLIYLNVKGGEK